MVDRLAEVNATILNGAMETRSSVSLQTICNRWNECSFTSLLVAIRFFHVWSKFLFPIFLTSGRELIARSIFLLEIAQVRCNFSTVNVCFSSLHFQNKLVSHYFSSIAIYILRENFKIDVLRIYSRRSERHWFPANAVTISCGNFIFEIRLWN